MRLGRHLRLRLRRRSQLLECLTRLLRLRLRACFVLLRPAQRLGRRGRVRGRRDRRGLVRLTTLQRRRHGCLLFGGRLLLHLRQCRGRLLRCGSLSVGDSLGCRRRSLLRRRGFLALRLRLLQRGRLLLRLGCLDLLESCLETLLRGRLRLGHRRLDRHGRLGLGLGDGELEAGGRLGLRVGDGRLGLGVGGRLGLPHQPLRLGLGLGLQALPLLLGTLARFGGRLLRILLQLARFALALLLEPLGLLTRVLDSALLAFLGLRHELLGLSVAFLPDAPRRFLGLLLCLH